MASYNDYHDYYDSRSRQRSRSRPPPLQPQYDNYDHYDAVPRTRVREDTYLSPTTVPRRSDRYSYDDRYSYPSQRSHDPTRARSRARSSVRKRRSWPPPPIVESEATSLAREAWSKQPPSESGEDEAPSKGDIDQEPIIQDVPGMHVPQEQRYVLLSDSEKEAPSAKSIPTPPTSEDEKASRGRSKRPSNLGLDMSEVAPEFQKRAPSTYAYSRSTPVKENLVSSGNFLSPDSLTPPSSDSKDRKTTRFNAASQPASPRRDSVRLSPRSRKARDYFEPTPSDEDAIATDLSDTPPSLHRRRSKSSRRPERRPSDNKSTSVVDFASQHPAESPRSPRRDGRRQTDGAASLPRPKNFEKSARPSPLVSSSAMSDLDQPAATSKVNSPASTLSPHTTYPPATRDSRNISPAPITSRASASPHSRQSPREQEYTRNGNSAPSSGTPSAAGSRPGTPTSSAGVVRMPNMPPMPASDLDWSSLMAATSGRPRTSTLKPPSRLSASMRMESAPEVPRVTSASVGGLPYPIYDEPGTPMAFTPTERAYPAFGPRSASLEMPMQQESMTLSRAESPSTKSFDFPNPSNARPTLAMRHSFANTSPIEARSPSSFSRPVRPETTRKTSLNGVPPTKQEVEEMLARGMPGCPRPDPVSGYDDWYTLVGCPNLDFCPYCIEDVFERTIYRSGFRRAVPRSLSTKVQCAFSTPWIRLAYILTLQQRKPDLILMRDLAEIEQTSEPCPGSVESIRSWYGLRDPEGYFVRDFHVCYNDVRKIERLLPTLNGLFVRLPTRASYEKRKCALRTEGNRFSLYLDKILDMHDRAVATRKLPDSMSLINLVERKLRIRECERDNMLLGGLWHFNPSMPDFTVCEDCYEEVVEPEARKNSDIALRFNRTVQPVYGEGIGTSCQLYSRRMRKVFRTAIKEDDIKYLGRKAKERRDAELRLQERYREVLRKARRLEERSGGSEDDERRLEREMEKISGEWKDMWE
ncbi:hypothetical protein Q7P35_005817 [Cladosporium inversicolor]